MIYQLSARYQKPVAALLLTIFYTSFLFAAVAGKRPYPARPVYTPGYHTGSEDKSLSPGNVIKNVTPPKVASLLKKEEIEKVNIGGPSQPEMSRFKSVGSDNLVNLFTGDFSYNIPLMDVGGYPVNIFYDGGVSMDQDASWVGLGWNINPGNVNRNMRGVPDDFDGTDVMKQTQMMKKNRTWGMNIGADIELVGIDAFAAFSGSVGASLGVSFNNYAGPAFDLGITGNTGFTLGNKSSSEKGGIRAGGSIGITSSTRGGVTITPGVSLTAKAFKDAKALTLGFGVSASTSYNSRTGIKAIQISEQAQFNGFSASLGSTSISFAKPSYIPSLRLPLTNTAWSGRFEYGSGVFGVKGSSQFEVYKQVSEIAEEDRVQTKPMVGYLYMQNAIGKGSAVMDFTRFNDNEVTPTTPVISAPQYTYDVYSIQGEGTGGTIRPYRNDFGYVRDNYTKSKDKSIRIGADIAPPGHYGASFTTINTPSTIGEWKSGNKLRNSIGFKNSLNGLENVYFRNPGETSVLNDNQYDNIGGTGLVRFKLGGTAVLPTVENRLEIFNKSGNITGTVTPVNSLDRKKRTQVINFFTAEEASVIGLDKQIKSYDQSTLLDIDGLLKSETINRVGNYRKKHHISQINVTEANGQRYVYGIPVYNIRQKDFTFTTWQSGLGDTDKDQIGFSVNEASVNSPNLETSASKDGYLQITETPAYAHSFLLSGLLSPDYVDVDNNGITENDQGSAVKFNYSCIKKNNSLPLDENNYNVSKWRTPLSNDPATPKANFMAGKRTTVKDDRGLVSYGERESWYLHSIESKSMIAVFTLEDRKDCKGSGGTGNAVTDELNGVNENDNSAKRLKKIDLYNKADLKANGITNARPVKTVHFEYSYKLCGGLNGSINKYAGNSQAPELVGPEGSQTNVNSNQGKLTLERIYFTYNGQENKTDKSQYVFDYGQSAADNPDYAMNMSDRWGTYKPVATGDGPNPDLYQTVRNAEHPYSYQTEHFTTKNATTQQEKDLIDKNASAWMLKKILLPSGGQMEINYESDDYAYVQNKRAAVMLPVEGFGASNNYAVKSNHLYDISGSGAFIENNYAFIRVPEPCTANDVKAKYLDGIKQICFKLAVKMPRGADEHVTSYANIDISDPANYGVTSDANVIWVKLDLVDGKNPLSLTAVEFLREQLPDQAFPGPDVSDGMGLLEALDMLKQVFANFGDAFDNPVTVIREDYKAQEADLSRCFARLNDPDGCKYGGGYRVRSIKVKDNWEQMTGQYTSEYGQVFDYTTKEVFNGQERPISSGVASYEPSFGGEENPFHTMVQVGNSVPLGPTSYGAIEMPVLDAFFPSPVVGYSKVTVTSLKKGTATQKSKSAVGKQVSEYYTAKDYPVYYSHTPLDPASDFQVSSSFWAFFWKYGFDSRTLSQGFLVANNDMHGKMKSQTSYPENDDKTPVNYTKYFYRNTGEKGLDEKFDFVYNELGGEIKKGNMGIDIELMTDTREFSVSSNSLDVQGQADAFPIFGLGPWFPFIWPVGGASDNIYRAVTTTKVINYHSIVDKVVVVDKGSEVSTENILFDAETGSVIVNKTNNEFKQPVYNTNYPAYWAYSGMGLAYKNIDAVYSGINFRNGKITNRNAAEQAMMFESGDEIYIMDEGEATNDCISLYTYTGQATDHLIWAVNKKERTSAVTDISPEFVFLTKEGQLYSRSQVKIRIVRSGKRNQLNAGVSSVTSLEKPWGLELKTPPAEPGQLVEKLSVKNSTKVINASAVEYKEKWQVDYSVIKRLSQQSLPQGPELITNGDFSLGNTGFTSEYEYRSPSSGATTAGQFTVGTSSSCPDHTTGSGNMMIINGAQDQRVVWSQTVPVETNTSYALSMWYQKLFNENGYNLRLFINDIQLGVDYTILGICSWDEINFTWFSGGSTTATISLIDLNTASSGNDFAIDDISFRNLICATPTVEVLDCEGYIEKNINPYVKGLLGTLRSHTKKVFYDNRNEADPLTATNISKNGALANFELYWNFNSLLVPGSTNNNLTIPGSEPANWVYQNEITRINSKGLELETKNALGVYTAAQYGYNKTIPVAIANNSKVNEMWYEGFEDLNYDEVLNPNLALTCNKLSQSESSFGGNVIAAASDNIKAHSGNKVLRLQQSSISRTININTSSTNNFNILFPEKAAKNLSVEGGNFTVVSQSAGVTTTQPDFSSSGDPNRYFGMKGHGSFNTDPGESYKGFVYRTEQYFQLPFASSLKIHETFLANSDFSGIDYKTYSWKIISVETGEQMPSQQLTRVWAGSSALPYSDYLTYKICLPAGIYKLQCEYGIRNSYDCPSTSCSNRGTSMTYGVRFSNLISTSYKNANQIAGCGYLIPAPATESMINPAFGIKPYNSTPDNNKMLLSAWIKQDCPSNNCGGNISLNIEGSSFVFTPSGPIIDGWQRIEGEFAAPPDATSAVLSFNKTASTPVYFDDLRIHPFNANMKSYVYDPVNLRLTAELDENNYAKFYEYDEEGTLVRTKAETKHGIKTIKETRSATQKEIKVIQ